MKAALLITLSLFFTLPTFAQLFGRNFSKGYYYTIEGNKHTGLISIDFDPAGLFADSVKVIYFKRDKDARKEKIMAIDLKSFIIAGKDSALTDSFVVMYTPNHHHVQYEYDFVQVLYGKGPVNLYDYRVKQQAGASFYSSSVITSALSLGLAVDYNVNYYYYYGQNANDSHELKKKDFKDVMSKMLADDPLIVQAILNNKYNLGDIHKMIADYNGDTTKNSTASK